MDKARVWIIKIINLLQKPELRILPGQLAYYLVITIIPLLALIVTFAAALSISTETLNNAISSSVPSGIANIISSIINSGGINFNLIVFYISAILLASNGTYSMINTANEIYKVHPKAMLSRRAKALTMIFILIWLFLFLFLVPVFGSTLYHIIIELIGSGPTIDIIEKILVLLKYPIIVLILYINIKLTYVMAPDKEIDSKTTIKGSVFTTVGWVLATEIFAFYLDRFAQYDVFYGSISNILVLLLWVYLLSYIYVIGMIINASVYKEESK